MKSMILTLTFLATNLAMANMGFQVVLERVSTGDWGTNLKANCQVTASQFRSQNQLNVTYALIRKASMEDLVPFTKKNPSDIVYLAYIPTSKAPIVFYQIFSVSQGVQRNGPAAKALVKLINQHCGI